jgi:hypothetical protein
VTRVGETITFSAATVIAALLFGGQGSGGSQIRDIGVGLALGVLMEPLAGARF